MRTVNAGEAREKLAHLLDAVASGEEIIIVRYGKPVACLTPIFPESVAFPDRSELRTSLPPSNESAGVTFRTLRDDERYWYFFNTSAILPYYSHEMTGVCIQALLETQTDRYW